MPVVPLDNTVQVAANKATDLTAKKAGDLALATVHLFTNNYTPLPTSVVGDFTEAAYVGYAAGVVAGWTANDIQADGTVTTDSTNVMPFVGPVGGAGPTVYGYYVLSAGGGTPLIYATRFTAPVALLDNNDVLNLVATYIQR